MNETLTQSALATARGEIVQLGKELENCQAALAKAQASCAEKDEALEELPKLYNEADEHGCTCGSIDSEHGCIRCSKWEKADRLAGKALSSDCGSALLKELDTLKKALIVANGLLKESQTREKRLKEWLEKKIAEAKEACKKATPFDFERGSDLTAYTAVKNFLKSEGLVCSTDWQLGGIAMLRSMKATLQLLREGKWTLDDADKWVEEQLK